VRLAQVRRVEPDHAPGTREPRPYCRLEQALQIERHVVLLAPQVGDRLQVADAPRERHFPAARAWRRRTHDDATAQAVDQSDHCRIRVLDQPVDLRRRIVLADCRERRDGVHDVAKRAQPDHENAGGHEQIAYGRSSPQERGSNRLIKSLVE
jgi:hypothetical protein